MLRDDHTNFAKIECQPKRNTKSHYHAIYRSFLHQVSFDFLKIIWFWNLLECECHRCYELLLPTFCLQFHTDQMCILNRNANKGATKTTHITRRFSTQVRPPSKITNHLPGRSHVFPSSQISGQNTKQQTKESLQTNQSIHLPLTEL